MTRSLKVKKHLSFPVLREAFSDHLRSIQDPRKNTTHSLHDAFMSAFACMYFQDPSLSEFQRKMEIRKANNNLRSLFDVKSIPKETQLRCIVDSIDSEVLRPVFKNYFERLRRGKYLESFQIIPNHYLCAIDGVYHHSSKHVHCDACLTKKHRDGTITYQHGVLQGAITHPDKRQVIPVMPEPISNLENGFKKQDCEINASKRFLQRLRADHPRLNLIIVGDGLFSKGPMIAEVLSHQFHFLFVAKPNDHKYMMEWLDAFDGLPTVEQMGLKGKVYRYTYQNNIPLNGLADARKVNYIKLEIIHEDGKVTYRNSWVTDIHVDELNVVSLAKGGRSRWKIENECFNTLKNQGYSLNHNFGHGNKHLSHTLYLLTLLAFFYHQIFELTDPDYQLCRHELVSKRHLWEVFRNCIRFFILNSWDEVMLKLMDEKDAELRQILNL